MTKKQLIEKYEKEIEIATEIKTGWEKSYEGKEMPQRIDRIVFGLGAQITRMKRFVEDLQL